MKLIKLESLKDLFTQLTMPTTLRSSPSPQVKGPPESPWQESFPPSGSPAQIMLSAIP